MTFLLKLRSNQNTEIRSFLTAGKMKKTYLLSVLILCLICVFIDVKLTSKTAMKIPRTSTSRPIIASQSLPNCSSTFKRTHIMTVIDMGRTGNKLYQLMTLLSTAKTKCYTPVISLSMRNSLGRLFNLSWIPVMGLSQIQSRKTFSEKLARTYAPTIERLDTHYNWSLYGYLQSWKYFQSNSEYLRETLIFQKSLRIKTNKYFADRNLSHKNITIAIHVRRGDRITKNFVPFGYIVPNMTYIEKAMTYFKTKFQRETVNFIVASDDMEWCKKHIQGANVFYTDLKSAEEDFVLLSRCDHTIMTGGSFGWMVAWFAGGDAVYWIGNIRPGSKLRNISNLEDVYMPHWVGLA